MFTSDKIIEITQRFLTDCKITDEDIRQEVFLVALKVRPSTSTISQLHYKLINRLEEISKKERDEQIALENMILYRSLERLTPDTETLVKVEIESALHSLDDDGQRVVSLYQAGYSMPEISKLTQYSIQKCQRIYNDALQVMRGHITIDINVVLHGEMCIKLI
jgi:DNA-directed RNA polymerase specialized sigma24 family protein